MAVTNRAKEARERQEQVVERLLKKHPEARDNPRIARALKRNSYWSRLIIVLLLGGEELAHKHFDSDGR